MDTKEAFDILAKIRDCCGKAESCSECIFCANSQYGGECIFRVYNIPMYWDYEKWLYKGDDEQCSV